MTYKEANIWALERNKKLLADDLRFHHDATVLHDDGSFFYWRNAFVEEIGQYKVIFTEHHGYHVFDRDDLSLCKESKNV